MIPSRYASVRLPGKPLVDICGKPLIQRVFESASAAKRLEEVIVATDDERIRAAVEAFGGRVVMSPASLPTGTDRVARAVEDLQLQSEVIINLQGDEPLIDPYDLDRLVNLFEDDPDLEMASLMAPLDDIHGVMDPNQVKVVVDLNNRALYFSRHPIPFWRRKDETAWNNRPACYWLHLGVYAFRRESLLRFSNWSRSMLEISESLEQLRALENGVRIKMAVTEHPWPGVNTAADVERVRSVYQTYEGADA